MLTLGINYSQMHDSSACIVRDGELLFAVAEERLSRLKHDAGFPKLAIQACLDFAKVSASQIDEVCFGWQNAGAVYRHDLKLYGTRQWPVSYLNFLNSSRNFLSMWHQQSGAAPFRRNFGAGKARFRFVDHHLAHALSAYAYSGFDDSAVVVMDGRGAWEATSIWRGHAGKLDHVATINWPDSLGLFYAQFTGFLGFVPNSDEWKVMGLAPYGQPGIDLSAFIDLNAAPYRVHSKKLIGDGSQFAHFAPLLGTPREPESDISDHHKNIAFAVQDACEAAMMSVVKMPLVKPESRNLCLPPSVPLNSKANGKMVASGIVEKFFVQPAASDDGVALGAALAPYLDGNGTLPNKPMRHGYWGPSFDDETIEKLLIT